MKRKFTSLLLSVILIFSFTMPLQSEEKITENTDTSYALDLQFYHDIGAFNSLSVKTRRVGTNFVIMPDNSLWGWLHNAQGQLGVGDTLPRTEPVWIKDNVAYVSHYMWATFAITTDGVLYGWGLNNWGNLGIGNTTQQLRPHRIMNNVVQVSSGQEHTIALRGDGSVWTWGNNVDGMLGNGTTSRSLSPQRVTDLGNRAIYVNAGIAHSAAITNDGVLWTWGNNTWGCLGDGTTTRRTRPVRASMPPIAASGRVISVNGNSAVTDRGFLYVWGANNNGQLGLGHSANNFTPQRMPIPAGFSVISSEFITSLGLFLRCDGTFWRFGPGTTLANRRPVQIADGVVEFSGSTMVRADGNLWGGALLNLSVIKEGIWPSILQYNGYDLIEVQ